MIRMVGDCILVVPIESEKKTKSGIIIPDVAQTKINIGIVQHIGSDDKIEVTEGDKVIFNNHAGTPIKDSDIELLIIKNSDVLGVIS